MEEITPPEPTTQPVSPQVTLEMPIQRQPLTFKKKYVFILIGAVVLTGIGGFLFFASHMSNSTKKIGSSSLTPILSQPTGGKSVVTPGIVSGEKTFANGYYSFQYPSNFKTQQATQSASFISLSEGVGKPTIFIRVMQDPLFRNMLEDRVNVGTDVAKQTITQNNITYTVYNGIIDEPTVADPAKQHHEIYATAPLTDGYLLIGVQFPDAKNDQATLKTFSEILSTLSLHQ